MRTRHAACLPPGHPPTHPQSPTNHPPRRRAACLNRWVGEKLETAAASADDGGGGGGAFSALLDPRRGGATAALLADLPPEDIAALRVCGGGRTGLPACPR